LYRYNVTMTIISTLVLANLINSQVNQAGLRTRCIQLTHSLKPHGVNP
jgi:hypothetical protein